MNKTLMEILDFVYESGKECLKEIGPDKDEVLYQAIIEILDLLTEKN